jgi:hypothetical protein
MKGNDYAFPGSPGFSQEGMTMRQYAAIKLRVPWSGDPDIDAMIRESRRADFAEKAVIGILSGLVDQTSEGYAIRAFGVADAMLAEWEKEAGHEK